MHNKTFLIINTCSYLGDTLIINTLCQNIKIQEPNSKIIYIADKKLYQAVKYQKDIDETVLYDKENEHKGLKGLLKFLLKYPHKDKIDAAFVMFKNDIGILISRFLGAKEIIAIPDKVTNFLITKKHFPDDSLIKKQDYYGDFIRTYSGKKSVRVPIKYNTEAYEDSDLIIDIKEKYKNKINIAFAPTCENSEKNIPIETGINIVKKIQEQGYNCFLLGNDETAKKYSAELRQNGCTNFVDLVEKTDIFELAKVLHFCNAFISIDTGSMHLGYAVGVPVVIVFYADTVATWAPVEDLYKSISITENQTVENIIAQLNNILEKRN